MPTEFTNVLCAALRETMKECQWNDWRFRAPQIEDLVEKTGLTKEQVVKWNEHIREHHIEDMEGYLDRGYEVKARSRPVERLRLQFFMPRPLDAICGLIEETAVIFHVASYSEEITFVDMYMRFGMATETGPIYDLLTRAGCTLIRSVVFDRVDKDDTTSLVHMQRMQEEGYKYWKRGEAFELDETDAYLKEEERLREQNIGMQRQLVAAERMAKVIKAESAKAMKEAAEMVVERQGSVVKATKTLMARALRATGNPIDKCLAKRLQGLK
jgi:hypothetical protein